MAKRRIRTGALLVALGTILAGCQPAARPPGPGSQGGSPSRSPKGPSHSRDARVECSQPVRLPRPPAHRPEYRMVVRVRPGPGLVSGRTTVSFTPDLDIARLEFRLWPNGPLLDSEGADLDTGPVSIDGATMASRQAGPTTLVVALGRTLRAGDTIVASLPWRLELPGPVFDRIAQPEHSVRLGSFFPILAWEPGVGWSQTSPTSALGETFTSPTADFSVRVKAPSDLTVFASGRQDSRGVWHARAVRDFAMVAGDFPDVVRRVVDANRKIEVTVAVERGAGAAARAFMEQIEPALLDFTDRFGPYPWDHFTMIINGDLSRGGIEYPTIVFQGPDSLERATSHEVGHQWFYSLVGNNQGRDPWLDEGLASYAQMRADDIQGFFDAIPVPADAKGKLGEPMTYWEDHQESYYTGVYAQGVHALVALGSLDKVDCALRDYVAGNAYGIARPEDLVESLRKLFPGARATLEGFGARL